MNVSRRKLIKSFGAGAAFAVTGSLVGSVSTARAAGRADLPDPAKLFDFSLVREAAKG
jgi:hypothetical protein